MYEVPKIAVPVIVHLTNEDSIAGTIWLTDEFISATGNALIEDFLNRERDNFFSFESKMGAFRLINKEHITFIETEQDNSEILSQSTLAPSSMVAHFTNAQTLYGLIYPVIPEETRVSDMLNQQQDFLVLYRQKQKIVFNRTLMVYANAN